MAKQKTKLNIVDIMKICVEGPNGYYFAECPLARAFLDAGNYKEPSKERPDSHVKALSTIRYSQWLLDHFPDYAKEFEIEQRPEKPSHAVRSSNINADYGKFGKRPSEPKFNDTAERIARNLNVAEHTKAKAKPKAK